MWGCMYNFGFHPWGFGPWIFLLILGLLAYLLFNAIRGHKKTHCNEKNDSLEILKNRLARGEISIEEFERLKSYLQAQA